MRRVSSHSNSYSRHLTSYTVEINIQELMELHEVLQFCSIDRVIQLALPDNIVLFTCQQGSSVRLKAVHFVRINCKGRSSPRVRMHFGASCPHLSKNVQRVYPQRDCFPHDTAIPRFSLWAILSYDVLSYKLALLNEKKIMDSSIYTRGSVRLH